MTIENKQSAEERKRFTLLAGTLIVLAWLVLLGWDLSPYDRYLVHSSLPEVVEAEGGALISVYVLGWSIMIVAMMLPTSLPLVTLFQTIVRQRANRTLLVLLLVGGYLGVWTLFGAAAFLGDFMLHEAIEQSLWLATQAWVIWPATLVLAGLYQFTSLKYRCLDQCRSPLSFLMQHWRGGREHARALWLGVHHGIFCVGCCWTLMLLMFAMGAANISWMLVLGSLMAVEKNISWGRRLSPALGVFLLGAGFVVVVGHWLDLPIWYPDFYRNT